MDYRSLHIKTVTDLRQIAKDMGVKIPAKTNKATLVEIILEHQAARAAAAQEKPVPAAVQASSTADAVSAEAPAQKDPEKPAAEKKPARRGRPRKEAAERPEVKPAEKADASGEADTAAPEVQATPVRRKAAWEGKVTEPEAQPAEKADASGKADTAAPEVQATPVRRKAAWEGKVTEPEAQPAEKADASGKADTAAPEVQATPVRTESVAPAGGGNPAQSTAPAQEACSERPAYQRPMSTQQRMGARTQSAQGPYRPNPRGAAPQPGRGMNRFEGANPRPQRSYEGTQGGFRRPAEAQHSYRRPEDGNQGFRRAANRYEDAGPAYRGATASEEGNANLRRSANGENSIQSAPVRTEDAPQAAAEAVQGVRTNALEASEQVPAMGEVNPAVPDMLMSGECGDGAGILEIHSDGYGFLRAENYLPGNRDVYVSAAQIRRFNLRTGDYVVGKTRAQQVGDRSVGLIYISEVNGQTPDMARRRRPFDSLVPVYPDERLRLERAGEKDISLRLIDMIAPIGKGQRGMIVSQPKAGKTTLLKKIANAITANNPDVHLIVLLIDERPEEVTDMRRSIQGEVVYSTFDEAPENHTRVSEMVLERAQRLVELGKDVVVLLDSITRLARAYNLVIPPTGRSLSGGLDPGALYKPKRFFGAARNIENGGSLTIIATALVDTGSRMDDIIFEEFKGTGNMELHLDRSLSDRRIFPAIDLYRSGTRREELLLDREEQEGVYQVRRMLSKGSPQEAAEQLISLMDKTKTNREFFQKLKGWLSACEKDGFTMR